MFSKIAHRGASGHFPENTRLAFEKAIAARVDMIELDCQLTLDGHVVVFHDERLERTARVNGEVKNKTLAEAQKARCRSMAQESAQGRAHFDPRRSSRGRWPESESVLGY